MRILQPLSFNITYKEIMEIDIEETTQGQSKAILQALVAGEKLTGLDMLRRFGSLGYRSRIADLRKEGVPIHTQMIVTASKKRIALYSIMKENCREVS